jgi:ligand-binding SRPBCC domain-containing protein
MQVFPYFLEGKTIIMPFCMKTYTFKAEQVVNAPLAQCFDFFSKAENLEKITPPLLHFHIITPLPIVLKKGALIDYKLKVHGVPMKWRTLIEEWQPNTKFVDTQLRGPYKLWHHTHEFESIDGGKKTLMHDTVNYALPFGFLGRLVHPILVKPDIDKIFAHRRKVIEEMFTTRAQDGTGHDG